MSNPLAEYYREIELCIPLHSGTDYYDPSVIELNSSGEVGIRAMTSIDEQAFKNPDMLLNGEAIKQVLLSCVSGLKKPELLLNYDVIGLLLAIKHASYEDDNIYTAKCPSCESEQSYGIDLLAISQEMPPVQPVKVVELDKVNVFIRPHLLKNTIALSLRQFKFQTASNKMVNAEMTEEQMLTKLSNDIKEISSITSDLVVESITKITKKDGTVVIENSPATKQYIAEYLNNISVKEIDAINDAVTTLNNHKNTKELDLTCEKCGHQWKKEVDVNPVNFFTGY